jgi:hypothetical protein
MIPKGQFTVYDLSTIGRAAVLAEELAGDYFGFSRDEWIRNPYGVFTRKQIDPSLYEADVFAQVVRYDHGDASKAGGSRKPKKDFGIILQDPHILRALLRSSFHDLWTLALYIMTHELIHIIRFRRREAEFFSSVAERDREEKLVHGMTREILGGIPIIESLLGPYAPDSDIPSDSFTSREGGEFHAHL